MTTSDTDFAPAQPGTGTTPGTPPETTPGPAPTPSPATGPLGDLGPLVLGGNVFGWTAPEPVGHAVLDAFVAAGGRLVDSADAYSVWAPGNEGGESERLIGTWRANRPGNNLLLATKVAKYARRPGLERSNVHAALAESLERLQAERVDLYYAHQDDPTQSPEQIAVTFGELVEQGRIGAIGLSNVSPDRLRAIVEAAQTAGLPAPAYAQDRWSLVERGIESTLLPTLTDLGIVELPYSPLASGFLTGKYRPGVQVDSPRAGGAGAYLERPGAAELLRVLGEVAEELAAQPASIALAWLRSRPAVGAPIASARTPAQLQALLATPALTDAHLARLDAASDALG